MEWLQRSHEPLCLKDLLNHSGVKDLLNNGIVFKDLLNHGMVSKMSRTMKLSFKDIRNMELF